MPLGFGDGGFDSLLKKAAASAKVMAKDAVKGGSNLVSKVAETDVKSTARRFTNKVMERAEGSQFTLVEDLPEVESAMVNLKQTEAAYRELLAVLKDAFVAQGRAVIRQQRVANRAEVIGRDLEGEEVGGALCSYSSHLVACAEKGQELNGIKDAADVEEKAQDDFDYRVYDTPAARLIGALEAFLSQDLAQAMAARTKYKDSRREVSLNTKKLHEMESKNQWPDRVAALKQQIEEQTAGMTTDREELMKLFMVAEQQKPALQSSVHTYLQAQLQYHRECAQSADKAMAALSGNQQ
mmetsp:Transcript_9582/g.22716  ORF Transcript_9582/g.22716 Transcript_9582/m.22716 type:complete len:296 (-) Transcript_9582:280-1167(-)